MRARLKALLVQLPALLRIQGRVSALEVECIKLRSALEAELLDDGAALEQAFNGQRIRRALIEDLFRALAFRTCVETGACTGLTTHYLATRFEVTVLGVESDPLLYRAALRRLEGTAAQLELASSTLWLQDPRVRARVVEPALFYLDAHWEARSPLRDELAAIRAFARDFCIVVDDFAVPGDASYGFDREPEVLALETFRELFTQLDLVPCFPAAPACRETGARRGCVVLFPASRPVPALPSLVRAAG